MWVDDAIEKRKSTTIHDDKPTLFNLLLESRPEQKHFPTDQEALVDQAELFFLAGVDTTSAVLAGTVYSVLFTPEIKSRLQGELRQDGLFTRHEFNRRKIQKLPYLVRCSNSSPGYCQI